MNAVEIRDKILNDETYFLEVIFTSNPEAHANLMRKYGVAAGIDVLDLISSFDTLKNNRDYMLEMQNIPIVWENLPYGYEGLMVDAGAVKTTPVVRTADLPTTNPTDSIDTTGTTGTTSGGDTGTNTENSGQFWNVAGTVIGGVLSGWIGANQQSNQPPPTTKKSNSVWWVTGGFVVIIVLILIFTLKKK